MFSRAKFTHWLFIAFWVYALLCFLWGTLSHLPNAIISTPFIAGACAIAILSVVLFIHRRVFEIALFFFFIAATFYLEFNPYTVSTYTFVFNSVTLFAGKVIPLIFLIMYLYYFRKPVIHFVRTTKLWN